MIIQFVNGEIKQVSEIRFKNILGRSMLGTRKTKRGRFVYQCVEEIAKIGE